MHLAISHIAWPWSREEEFLALVASHGVSGLEIAMSRVWPEPATATKTEILAYKNKTTEYGLKIISTHALLYTRPDLELFGDASSNRAMIDYLKKCCGAAALTGAKLLVFGSPRNRKRKGLPWPEAMDRAAALFSPVAREACNLGTCFCMEPLGPEETDFINTAAQGLALVEMVDSPGFGLHLDSKALCQEDYITALKRCGPFIRHFHISEPGLARIGSSGQVPHAELGALLARQGYRGYASIEMLPGSDPAGQVEQSLRLAMECYCPQTQENANDRAQ